MRSGGRILVLVVIAIILDIHVPFEGRAVTAAYDNFEARYPYNVTGARFLQEDGEEYVRVVVGFKSMDGIFEYGGSRLQSQFKRSMATTMTIPVKEMDFLSNHPQVEFIEEDVETYAQKNGKQRKRQQQQQQQPEISLQQASSTEETTPWGITAVQGDDDRVPRANPKISRCFSVCVIDSGVLITHQDMPYNRIGYNVKGASFGYGDSGKWNEPPNGHGTHVAGTIMAEGGNNIGVRGVVDNPQRMCLLVAKIFGDGPGTTSNSYVDLAVEWCVDNGAKVINLSLGTPLKSYNSEIILKRIEEEEDVLVVAASGNDGMTYRYYPASYDGVISVGSIDQDFSRSSFSNYNPSLTVVAPGDNIVSLSTSPAVTLIDQDDNYYFSILMDDSVVPETALITGTPQKCGIGDVPCLSAYGKICVFERGEITFAEKAKNCETVGGIAAIVYNNQVGNFFGTLAGALGQSSNIQIPVVSVAREDGIQLLAAQTLSLRLEEGAYTTMSGTSMAAPHVSGAIAKIWAARPDCTKVQIRDAIINSAKDLGPTGFDNEYGHGLVQAVDAYNYLLNLPPPCGRNYDALTGVVNMDDYKNAPVNEGLEGIRISGYNGAGRKLRRRNDEGQQAQPK